MAQLSYRRHRFPAEIIQHAIWLYLRFILSYRDVEELIAERGLDVSYETVRRWVLKFGPLIARKLRQGRPRPSARWHLDEMVVRIAGKRMYLWRAVDHEGEVLDMLVQRRRDTQAALRLMRKLLKKQGFAPKLLVTDKLGSYGSAFRQLRLTCSRIRGLRKTIARKTPIKSCGDESARCSGSSRLDPRSVFSTSIPRSTTPSTTNDISSLGRRFGSSEPKRPPGGKMRLPSHETGFDLAHPLNPARYRDNALLHLSYSCAAPILPAMLVTHDPNRKFAIECRNDRDANRRSSRARPGTEEFEPKAASLHRDGAS
jgi:transposase-like protein